MLKKAMIMAAGVGSRLGELSEECPKPLVRLVNKPAMDIIIEHLSSFGIEKIIANTYYKSEIIEQYYKNNANIFLNKEDKLSGTAGGVRKCRFFFDKDEDFIVMSGDGLSDVDISRAYDSHKKSGAIATIVLKEVEKERTSLYGIVVPDENSFVLNFQEKPKTSEAESNLANTGIYIFKYEIFNYIPENTFYDFAKNVFPSLMQNGEKINTYIHRGYWSDIGSIEQYKESHYDILNHKVKNYTPAVVKTETGRYSAGSNLIMKDNAEVYGNCVFGDNCRLGKNSKIINSILWDNVTVEENTVIENSIVLSNTAVKKNLLNSVEAAKEIQTAV